MVGYSFMIWLKYNMLTLILTATELWLTSAVAVSTLEGLDPENPLPPITPYFVMRVGRLPLVGYHPPGGPGLAAAVAASSARARCALLANHGSIASAESLEAAVDAVEEIEETEA